MLFRSCFFYPQCLLFTAMPFAEDLRQFSFAPLDANKKWMPTGNLYNLCLNLIAIKLDPKRVFLMHGLNESYIFFVKKMRGNYSKLYNIFRNSDVT